jgi:hypothetical protein
VWVAKNISVNGRILAVYATINGTDYTHFFHTNALGSLTGVTQDAGGCCVVCHSERQRRIPALEMKKILRGVYPEREMKKILRFAQDDKRNARIHPNPYRGPRPAR